MAASENRVRLAIAGWVALIVAGHLLGGHLTTRDHIGAPPLVGSLDTRISWRLAGALALAVGALRWAPVLAATLSWRRLLATTWVVGAGWALLLAAGDGLDAIVAPLRSRFDYLTAVDRIGNPGDFLRSFVDSLHTYPTHVKGHPPGMLLLLWALHGVGLGGAAPAAALVIGVGALAAVGALVALRAVNGEQAARRAAPFLALNPAAVWIATSADGFFAGVAAIGISVFALATHGPASRAVGRLGADLLALGSGITLGCALFLSYGVLPLGAIALALALHRRAWRTLVVAAIGVAAVYAAFLAAGFWWLDGLSATHRLYFDGVASRRPYAGFLVISLAAFALAVGPVAAAALARARRKSDWLLPAAAIVALASADLSGLSRGETERIWLIFVPWILVAAATLRGATRRWLAVQLALGLALQAGVSSPW